MNKSNHTVTLPIRDYEQFNKTTEDYLALKDSLRNTIIPQYGAEPSALVKVDELVKIVISILPYKLDEGTKIVTI